MSDTPIKDAIEALYKPIESIVKTLAGPAAEEIGLSFRDSVQVWRLRRQARLFERVKHICKEAGIKPQTVKLSFLFDVVEKASLEEDDELQELWANLLANAADTEHQGLISTAFPEILKQLSKDEAVFLADFYTKRRATAEELAEMTRNGIDIQPLGIQQVYLDNLKRLRLIDWIDRPQGVRLAFTLEEMKEPILRITAFGEAFVDACTSPSKRKSQNKRAQGAAGASPEGSA